jgi:hypothetical protein
MGKLRGLYVTEFAAGTRVRIADRADLEAFQQTWSSHHPLVREQLEHAGQVAVVQSVQFYHGADELYDLREIPGIWHECCLLPEDPELI